MKMKWIMSVLLVSLIQISNANTASINLGLQLKTYKKYQSHQAQFKSSVVTAAPHFGRSANDALVGSPQRQQRTDMPPLLSLSAALEPQLEIDTLQCPVGCVCQYAHFADLPISRWIQHMQARRPPNNANDSDDDWDSSDTFGNSEMTYDSDDDTHLNNPFMKQATCILQEDSNITELIQTLPHDLHALILLYTSSGQNKSINLSTLRTLNQLTTLEIRGGANPSLRVIFDEPLSFLQHANFEAVSLLGSENYKRPKNPVHPRDSFDYKPRSETFDEGDADGNTMAFGPLDDNGLIVPYDIYKQELLKARMPTFYGWEHLEVLRIHGCHLTELQWEMFDGLMALEYLSLERNGITEVPPFSFYGAMHIRTLSLAHNFISDLHYRALAGLLQLEVLDLSNNRLEKFSERSFPPFPKLVRVDFRNNPIRYILPASFWVMNSTRIMDFDSATTPLQLRNNQPFESLAQLEILQIGNVAIGNLEQNIFKGLMALEKLSLRGKIRSIEFDAFAGLIKLRELELSNCGIQKISMDALMGCKNLEVLDLSHNNISYFPPGLLDDQPNLEEIYLQANQLRTLPVTFFLQPKLRLARLSENPWQCSCEMNNWHPKITNQERRPRTKRCITDYRTGKRISCRRVDSYIYENSYAPRCKSHNERSVFYVLRKQLQCGPGRVVATRGKYLKHSILPVRDAKHHLTHWRRIELSQLQLGQDDNHTRFGPLHKPSQLEYGPANVDNRMAQRNTLLYAIQQKHPKRLQDAKKGADNNISNEIHTT